MRKHTRTYEVIGLMVALTATAAGGISWLAPTEKYTNLKVLPRNITSKDLQRIMVDDFEDGLGVSCSFCHANAKDGHGLDYASDAKPEKQISRMMMRMTVDVNRKWLKVKHVGIGDPGLVVQCTTCHNGQAIPEGAEPK